MKISGTRSYILVEYDHRSIKIQGELTITPAFYADIASIKRWEPPYDHIAVSEEEKLDIISKVTEETKHQQVPIYFD
jgi:hypothetical protein